MRFLPIVLLPLYWRRVRLRDAVLAAILFALFSGKRPEEILAIDARAVFNELGLAQHLTAQRSNGLFSMVERIRADAREAAAAV